MVLPSRATRGSRPGTVCPLTPHAQVGGIDPVILGAEAEVNGWRLLRRETNQLTTRYCSVPLHSPEWLREMPAFLRTQSLA